MKWVGVFFWGKKNVVAFWYLKRREDCDQVQSSVRQAYWLALFYTWPDTLTPLSLCPPKYSFLRFAKSHRCPSNIPNPLVCLVSSYKIKVELSKAVPWVSWWTIHLWLLVFDNVSVIPHMFASLWVLIPFCIKKLLDWITLSNQKLSLSTYPYIVYFRLWTKLLTVV